MGKGHKEGSKDYVIRVLNTPLDVDAAAWNSLLRNQENANPFMRHEYLAALHESGCAVATTGWLPRLVTLWQDGALCAAAALYIKNHSYGEYVFDWAWAQAFEQHGLRYYPKAVVAPPFTPVPGARLLACDAAARAALLQALLGLCRQQQLSSLHILLANSDDLQAAQAAGMMQRHTVQFHWTNQDFTDFEGFLAALTQEKRKKIRAERRKVADAGVCFRALNGQEITSADWDFFYRCYERTYLEHGNPPYLNRDFFDRLGRSLAEHWVLFIGERAGEPIAASLIALQGRVAYGRYWGALQRVDSLHFEACYYQPIQWCIAQGLHRFEGGAQGEHKMARALMPVKTHSAHWVAHPAFADAIHRFLDREGQGIEHYLEALAARSPFRP
ncbi:MAG: hypothetical protein RLZZ126_430 [Pseudomonadota bacterium]|jgi:predicted N-acyltransferase